MPDPKKSVGPKFIVRPVGKSADADVLGAFPDMQAALDHAAGVPGSEVLVLVDEHDPRWSKPST